MGKRCGFIVCFAIMLQMSATVSLSEGGEHSHE
jgi:hypothetical protein